MRMRNNERNVRNSKNSKGQKGVYWKQKGSNNQEDDTTFEKERPGSKDDKGCVKSNSITVIIPRWLYCYLPIAMVLSSVVIGIILTSNGRQIWEHDVLDITEALGWEAVDAFVSFDKDGDLSLNLQEAKPLLANFVGGHIAKNTDIDVKQGEDTVLIEANFIPLNISTMTKDFEHDPSGNESFVGLFSWQSVNIPVKEFGVSSFLNLLPKSLENISPGMVYTIVEPLSTLIGQASLPSNRYDPPRATERSVLIQRLLGMLHPRPFLIMRFYPQGIKACVRALSKTHIEVVFRMHTEFQLNDPPALPFWFTPAQFTGSLTMSLNGSTVEHFHLYVPNERRLNVDMEWLNDPKNIENMEVDIGYMPLMELRSKQPSTGVERKIVWDEEISEQDAKRQLEESFFPFKQVSYYNLSDAFDKAKSESKLVHSILLWGALDDQSC